MNTTTTNNTLHEQPPKDKEDTQQSEGEKDELSPVLATSYFKKNWADDLENLWAKCMWVLPCFEFGMYDPPAVEIPKRWKPILDAKGAFKIKGEKDITGAQKIKKVRGLFNLRNLFDGTTMRWMMYSSKSEAKDLCERIEVELTQVGLLAALVSTISFAMFQGCLYDGFDIESFAGMGYVLSWLGSSVLLLCSTVLSVIIILTTAVTKEQTEFEYYISIFEKTSLIGGTQLPLYLLYVGFMLAALGIFFSVGLYFTHLTTFVVIVFAILTTIAALLGYFRMVAALFTARNTVKFMEHGTKKVNLNVEDIKKLMIDYTQEVIVDDEEEEKGEKKTHLREFEEFDDVDDFIAFILTQKVDGVKEIGDSLLPNTERRVKKMFDIVMEANLLKRVEINEVIFAE